MKRQVNFLGLGFEVGQSLNGLAFSPQYARKYFSLLKEQALEFRDYGDISSTNSANRNKFHTNKDLENFEWQLYQNAFLTIRKLLQKDSLLINWGGDHSVGIATVGGFCREYSNGYVIWVDAHADLNLPTSSLTGNLHGMPLAILLNLAQVQDKKLPWLQSYLNPKKLIYIGLRDLDPFEKEMIKDYDILNYDMDDIRRRGMSAIAAEISKLVQNQALHVSFDIDSIDPIYAPSTGICVSAGLNLNDLEILGTAILTNENLKSVDIVEINPAVGSPQQVAQTYLVAFNFLKNIEYSSNKGVSYDTVSRSNQTKHQVAMESRLQF